MIEGADAPSPHDVESSWLGAPTVDPEMSTGPLPRFTASHRGAATQSAGHVWAVSGVSQTPSPQVVVARWQSCGHDSVSSGAQTPSPHVRKSVGCWRQPVTTTTATTNGRMVSDLVAHLARS